MSKNKTGLVIDGTLVKSKRQVAMVFDLNKCLGCHTCAVACKTQWTREEGMANRGCWVRGPLRANKA